ncbi:MAG: putative nucleotidyltransferase substrate binding domain-containing protein [Solirubrobacteraceae bacterium]
MDVHKVALDGGLSETARFLALRPPFDTLSPEELGEVVTQTEIEFYPARAPILTEDGGPVTFLRVILSGAVDITHDDRLLDLLGAGDTFGHAAMLSGLPPGFEARAAEDTLCYRIPVAVARPLLERARSRELAVGVPATGHQPVTNLIRSQTVRCQPDEPVSEIARRMTASGASATIVDLGEGAVGIITDRDLRTRVLGAGLPSDVPAGRVMTTPVFTVAPDRLGGEVLFELLERGIGHAPVMTDDGRLIGVLEDVDLLAAHPRSWFGARRAIARAGDIEALAALAVKLPDVIVDLHAANIRALEVARVLSTLLDALTVRALELAPGARALPADGVVWVALGSHARRELMLSSHPRGMLIASEPPPPGWTRSACSALAACGLPAPPPTLVPARWGASGDPVVLEALVDRRALWGTPRDPLPTPDGGVVELLARSALSHRPPTGFDAAQALHADGTRSDWVDIRVSAVAPIVALALWGAAAAGSFEGSTVERLGAAAGGGVLLEAEAATLTDAFELALELALSHQAGQRADGRPPDDRLQSAALSPLTRDHLRDVFRAIAAVQRRALA